MTTLLQSLERAAIATAARRSMKADTLVEIFGSQLGVGDREHDWRNLIPDAVRELWPVLDNETRMVAFLVASESLQFVDKD